MLKSDSDFLVFRFFPFFSVFRRGCIMDFSLLINSMITGLFVGIGSALGTWLVTRHFIRHLERLEAKLKSGNGKRD